MPILAASILCDESVEIIDIPNIIDVDNMIQILSKLGASIKRNKKNVIIDSKHMDKSEVNSVLSKTMRSSIFLLGPLLAKFKKANIFLPGGCQIGKRPIDIHIKSLKKL